MTTSTIITMLKADHQEVSSLFAKAIATTERNPGERTRLFEKINEALRKHTQFEEEQLYPVLAKAKNTKDEALEAFEEHGQIKMLLADLAKTKPTDERWKAKMTVLSEDVHHHVQEEEKSDGLFAHLKKRLDEATLVELGEQYDPSKQALAGRH